MARNKILQVVVFSLLFAVAAAFGERARNIVRWIEELSHVILRITGYVMLLAPVALPATLHGATPAVGRAGRKAGPRVLLQSAQ